jgi:3-methyl-2-oxobutanoate hydroxymethyltransferase
MVISLSPKSVNAIKKSAAIRARKLSGPKVSMLTAYDFPTAKLFDEAGVDALLVGDSLGMVMLGFPDTTHVTMDHMRHHIAAVARAKPKALIIGDLPIDSYTTPEMALKNARLLVEAGAEAVKLEGGVEQAEQVRALTEAGIPVCGHLGMLPQNILKEGGYRKKGKTPEQSAALLEGAMALVDAGVFAIVLECVVAKTADWLTEQVPVPLIGIGCGDAACDGEVAVCADLLGTFPWFVPPFARPEAHLAPQIVAAASSYKDRITRA